MNEPMFFRNGNKMYRKLVDDRLEYRMAQLLKPGMLNFKIKPDNFAKIQPVAAGKNGVQF